MSQSNKSAAARWLAWVGCIAVGYGVWHRFGHGFDLTTRLSIALGLVVVVSGISVDVIKKIRELRQNRDRQNYLLWNALMMALGWLAAIGGLLTMMYGDFGP
jgi:uncharacterized membrane protein HdeD (DUF308 family)